MAVRRLLRKGTIWAIAVTTVTVLLWPGWPLLAEIQSIRLYQRFGSPVSSKFVTCRFRPTCSHFALQTLEDQGFLEGNWRVFKRLVHCSPAGALFDWLRSDGRTSKSMIAHRFEEFKNGPCGQNGSLAALLTALRTAPIRLSVSLVTTTLNHFKLSWQKCRTGLESAARQNLEAPEPAWSGPSR